MFEIPEELQALLDAEGVVEYGTFNACLEGVLRDLNESGRDRHQKEDCIVELEMAIRTRYPEYTSHLTSSLRSHGWVDDERETPRYPVPAPD